MNKIITLLIIIIFAVLTLCFTYPLVLHPNKYIPGFFDTTESLSILHDFWWAKFVHLKGLNFSLRNYIAVPFGIPLDKNFVGYPVWNFLNKHLILVSNEIFAYNLNILFSYFFSGILMYVLVFYLTKSRLSAILSGIIYSFSPYHAVRTWQHLGLAHIEWLPLYIFALLKLKENINIRNILLTVFGLSLILCFDFYYAYFASVVTACFILFLLGYKFKGKMQNLKYFVADFKIICAVFITFIFCFLILSPVILPILKSLIMPPKSEVPSAFTLQHRPFEDLFMQSAKLLSYFLPAAVHSVFGKFTEQFVGSQFYGVSFTEHTLYLGWAPLILAFLAFRRWRRNKKAQGQSPKSGERPFAREDFYIGFFIFLAVVAWFFSQPPWWNIFDFKIYMPSFFMYKILPMYRAYCRFGIVVMLAVAILAGFGLKFILERFKSQKVKIAIICLFSGLVLFEFWNWPPYKVIDVSKAPAVYYWLKEQPGDFVIAEYPLDADSPNEMYKFYQTKHENKIINGAIPGTPANKVAQTIIKLSNPRTAGVLKWMGVKYVLIHREDYLKTGLIEEIEELDKISNNHSLKFIRGFPSQECPQKDIMCVQKTGPIDVYEVIAMPEEPRIKEELKNGSK